MKTVLKAKVREIVITDRKINYEGSLTLSAELMKKLGVCEYEQVWINGKNRNSRIMTYLLKGKPGQCELNGGAVHSFEKGDIVHLLFFATIPDNETIKPIIL